LLLLEQLRQRRPAVVPHLARPGQIIVILDDRRRRRLLDDRSDGDLNGDGNGDRSDTCS
jgi:hypothetical protein